MRKRILMFSIMLTMVVTLLSFNSIRKHEQVVKAIGNAKVESKAPSNLQAGTGDIVYVGDNISTGAGVKIFRRDDLGRLTEQPNSPVPTGGKGILDLVALGRSPSGIFAAVDIGPYEHDGNLIVNKDRTRLFTVNQGSDDLSVFDISPDGLTLTPVPGSPFKTGRVPASVALAAFDTVIVVNKNDPPGNPKPPGQHGSIMTFKMAANGSLTPVPNSVIELPGARCGEGVFCDQTSTPSQVLVSEDGKLAFVNDFFAGLIRPYVVRPDGTLKATKPFDIRSLGPNVLPANGPTFPFSLGLQIYPGKNLLYTGLLFENKVAVFKFNPKNGKLKFLGTADNGGSTVCWFVISKSGRFMWTSNQASDSVSTYDLSNPEQPVEIQVVQFAGCGEPSQVALDPTGQWIYYINSPVTNKCPATNPDLESNMVHTLKIGSDGLMTEISEPTIMRLPLGERAQGVATK